MVSGTTAALHCRRGSRRQPRISGRPVTVRRRSCPASHSIAGSGSIADSRRTTTICPKATTGAVLRTSSGSRMRQPMRRFGGSPRRVPQALRHAGGSGSAATSPTRHTSRRRIWRSGTARGPTTARSRSSTASSRVCFMRWMSGTKPAARSSSSRRIMEKAWASTAKAHTESLFTTRHFECPGSWPARRFPQAACPARSPGRSTCCQRLRITPGSPAAAISTAARSAQPPMGRRCRMRRRTPSRYTPKRSWGGARAARAPGTALRDPKDGIRFLPRLNRAMSAARTEPALAIRELTAVLAEDPGVFMARRTRAVAYAAAGRHDLAVADLRALDKEGQLTPEDAIVLGDNLRFAGRLEEAALILERAQRENPAFAQPLISLAEVRIQAHKYDEAASLCERILKLVPDHIEALRRLGDLALLREDSAAAAARYERILALDAGDVAALTKLGVVRARSGRPDEAIQLFREAVEREPGNAEALLYLAGALAAGGHPSDALPYFELAIAAGPPSTMALNGLGLASQAIGDTAKAETAFKKSLQLDPDQPEIAKALAQARRRG